MRRPAHRVRGAVRGGAVSAALLVLASGGCGGGVLHAPPETEPAPLTAGAPLPPGTYDDGVDVLHYDIEIALPDRESWIAARTRVRAAVLSASELVLDLTGLRVESVTLDGTPVQARHENGRLRVPLAGAAAGDTVTAEVLYGGVPDDGLVIGDNVHGRRSVFADNWPNRARFWFPAKDHPSDKATVAFTVHAPRGMQVVANGTLTGEPTETPSGTFGPGGARRTWRWENRVPIPTYTMVIGAAQMVTSAVGTAACGSAPASPRADGCAEVTWWAFSEDAAAAARVFGRADRMVDHFTRTIGPFPYEKLANVQSSTRFGGMENASAIFYSESALAEGRLSEGTVSHEIAHQWFGDSVTEADWHHLWLSEGFATYFGAQFFQVEDGEDDFRRRMDAARLRYVRSDDVHRPVLDEDVGDLFDLLNRNSYQKGGWVLHMLRGVIGDDAFFRGIRAYYREHRDGTALTDDLRRIMEREGARPLGWFFDQWLRRPGYPVFRVEHAWEAETGALEITVHQEQDPSWPTFRVPVEIEVRHAAGVTREHVVLETRRQTVRTTVPGRPIAVVLDPDGLVLKRMAGEEDAPGG